MIFNCFKLSIFLFIFALFSLTSCSSLDEKNETATDVSEQNKSETVKKEDLAERLYENSLETKNKKDSFSNEKIVLNEVSLRGNSHLKKELNQVLSYHCMKHRKKFTSENQCLSTVNQIVKKCETLHTSITTDFVKCIKKSLIESLNVN